METRMGEGARVEGKAEQENYSSRVLLHIFRHEQKGKDPAKIKKDQLIGDKEQLLTEAGRKRALAQGKGYRAAPTAIAIGSDFPRAQETAGFVLAGAHNVEGVTGDESLDELRAKLDKERKFGTVIGSDPRLGFKYTNQQYMDAREGAYENNRGLEFNVHESDGLANKFGDTGSTTYNRGAGNVAEVLEKYAHVSKNYDKLIQDQAKEKEYGKVLERFLGTHMGMADIFLTKIVEKIKGISERDKLVKVLNGQGFDPREGFDVEIDTIKDQTEPQMRIKYEKKDPEGKEVIFSFNEVIPKEILRQMVEEGKVKE